MTFIVCIPDIGLFSRGHFVMLIEIGIHLMSCNPGHIWSGGEADLEFLCSQVQALP